MNLDTRGMLNPGQCQQGRWWLLLLSKEVRLQQQGFDSRDQQINLKTISCTAAIILHTGHMNQSGRSRSPSKIYMASDWGKCEMALGALASHSCQCLVLVPSTSCLSWTPNEVKSHAPGKRRHFFYISVQAKEERDKKDWEGPWIYLTNLWGLGWVCSSVGSWREDLHPWQRSWGRRLDICKGRIEPQESPWKFSSIYPHIQSLPTLLLCALTYIVTLRGQYSTTSLWKKS